VIEGACGLQWVLQYRRSGKGDNRWQGKSFSATQVEMKRVDCD
jgi:hypothetical protein